jgi:hypothetical protein
VQERIADLLATGPVDAQAPKAWVQALAAVAEECFAVQRKLLESHEARVKAAKDRPATGCAAVR